MKPLATGFLELNNLTSAIESADHMLKAANLDSIQKIRIGPAAFTIIIRGDAPSVEAALIAGEASAKRAGGFLITHFIEDFDSSIENLIAKEVQK